jgi:hypothetical protein
MTDKKFAGSPWPVAAVFVAAAVFLLGLEAWGDGREIGFGLLLLAGSVLIGCERIAVAIRGSERG